MSITTARYTQVRERIESLTYDHSVKPGLRFRILPPDRVLEANKAICIEAALASAKLLEDTPSLLYLKFEKYSHAVHITKIDGQYGSIGFSREPTLQSRDPTFDTIEELAKSYDGCKAFATIDWSTHYPNWDTRHYAMRPSKAIWENRFIKRLD